MDSLDYRPTSSVPSEVLRRRELLRDARQQVILGNVERAQSLLSEQECVARMAYARVRERETRA